jgi:hypothetical protein
LQFGGAHEATMVLVPAATAVMVAADVLLDTVADAG